MQGSLEQYLKAHKLAPLRDYASGSISLVKEDGTVYAVIPASKLSIAMTHEDTLILLKSYVEPNETHAQAD